MQTTSLYNIPVTTIDGTETTLEQYAGKPLLIVNVASKCGFTSQYSALEDLHKKYKDAGLTILGFPCNQFGGQEPGTEAEIATFCSMNFGVTFPLFKKIDVNGENTHPLYVWLKKEAPGLLGSEAIKWNFTKFLISKDGKTVKRFAPTTTPESLVTEIKELL